MSQRAVTVLVFSIVGLLAIVIMVGLAQRLLDPTGVAVSLCTLLTGVVGGVLWRGKSSPPGGDGR